MTQVTQYGERVIGDGFSETVDAARRGDETAWRAVYEDLAPTMLGYLRAQGAGDAAEDLVGEVFVDLARNLRRFRGDEAAFRSWAFTVAHHRLVDERRRRARRPVEPVADPPERPAAEDPEAAAITAATNRWLLGLLDDLTSDQRTVLLLRLFGGLTVPEAARILGRSVGATKALQRRGLDALRRRVEADGAYPSGRPRRSPG